MPPEQTDLCEDMQPWLAAYALGESADEADRRAHLAVCPRCQHDLHEYQLVALMLPYSATEATPRPELRDQVIAAISRQATPPAAAALTPPAGQAQPAARAPSGPRRARSFWAALAFAALSLMLLGWNVSLLRELDRQAAQVAQSRQNWQTMIVLLDDSSLRGYALVADPPPEPGQYASHGRVWGSPQSQVACLVAQGLPELPNGRVYQVWLVRSGEQASGGTFEPRSGKAWTFVESYEPISNYSEIFVTVEPTGGSPAPAGQRILSGSLSTGTTAG
ncbi:MAG TPA: anti-sigma factor, partial [Roseiflexaceae bacterium]|nr:anti-sigma factor [Roseiflexaceae bacterium]